MTSLIHRQDPHTAHRRPAGPHSRRAAQRHLRVLPFKSAERWSSRTSHRVALTVTTPSQGLEPTIALAVRLVGRATASRRTWPPAVRDHAHLTDVVAQLRERHR